MIERCDLLVVGGGPVGLATAIGASQAGMSVTVLEQRAPTVDKACGEGIMPAGVELLARLGVEIGVDGGMPFLGIRFLGHGAEVQGAFAAGAGLGVRRTRLHEAMAARARALGIRLRYGCALHDWAEDACGVRARTTEGELYAGHLVGADGLHSAVRRRTGLAMATPRFRRFGMRRHFRCRPWSAFVEVHWADTAEAYVTPVGPDEVGVAVLWHGAAAPFDECLARFPDVHARLAGAAPASAVRGAGPFYQRVRRRYRGRVALVGDAAGYLDPLTGEGITLGLRSAQALVETLRAQAPLALYERRYRELSRDYYRLTGALLAASRVPWIRRRLVRSLATRPDVFDRLVQINAGQRPIRSVGVAGTWQLVSGLLAAPGN